MIKLDFTMKNMILIFSALAILSCGNDDEQNKSMIAENATLYYDPSGIDNCVYTFKTDNGGYFYTTDESLDNKFREEGDSRVKISYSKTERRLNCGFAGYLTIIKIESIQTL